jgi:hypothetical protein
VNKKLSHEMHRIQRRPNRSRLRIGASLFIASFALFPVPAHAYIAAGDRVFPGTLILPQIAPTDETYLQGATPFSGTPVPPNTRRTDAIGVFGKTLTESLGVRVREVYTQLDPDGANSRYGWQNLTATAQYMVVLDGPHEFLFSVGVDRQFGGTGAGTVQRRGFSGVGATTPSVYFGKGLGDLDIGYLRPLAISGTFGYLIGDKSPRRGDDSYDTDDRQRAWGDGPVPSVARLSFPERHRQASFLTAMTTRPSTGTAAPASAVMLYHAAE